MRLLPIALFLAFGTWIAGCAAPDVAGSSPRHGDVAGDDDDEPMPAKKKKTATATGTPVTSDTTPAGNTTPTTTDATVTPPSTTTPDTTTPTTTTTTPTTPVTTTPPATDPPPTTTPPAPTTFTTTANLNLREGPSTNDTIILTMPNGSTVEAIDETPTGNWYHVKYQGTEGWASGSYLQEN